MNELLSMGNYGIYVWPAFGVTFLILGLNLYLSFQENSNIRRKIRKYYIDKRHES